MMISVNTLIFILGGLLFLFVFSWFKKAAIVIFKKELVSNDNQKSVWSKLFQVFLVDWLVIGVVIGVFGTGFFSYSFFWSAPVRISIQTNAIEYIN